jgi:hypothetical protein
MYKANDIIYEIRKHIPAEDEPASMKQKVISNVQYFKTKKFGKSNLTLADLASFVNEHLSAKKDCKCLLRLKQSLWVISAHAGVLVELGQRYSVRTELLLCLP